MSVRISLVMGLGSVLVLAGCGGASPRATTANPEGDPGAASTDPASPRAEPLPPLERVETPRLAFFRARVASPKQLLDGALRTLSPGDRERLGGAELSETLAKSTEWLDLDSAVEMGAILNPRPREEPLFFYSFGVRSPDAVLAKVEREGETPLAGRGGSYYFTHSGDSCVLGRALGRTPYRVACADDRGALEQLEGWALRGFPAEDLGDEAVVAELDVKPIVAMYGKELRRLKGMVPMGAAALSTGEPKFDGALKKTLVALAEELVDLSEDASSVRFALAERNGDYEVGFSIDFRARSSWLATNLSELGGRSAPPPPAFDVLPASAVSAGYSHHLDDKSLEPIRKVLAELALGFGQKKGLGKSASHLEQAVREMVWSTPWSVSAVGPFVPATRSDGSPSVRPSWTLFGAPEKSQRFRVGYDHLVTFSLDKKIWSLGDFEEPLFRFERQKGQLAGFPSAFLYRWSFTEAFRKELVGRVEELPEEARKNVTPSALSFLMEAFGEGVLGVYERDGVTWVVTGRDLDALKEGLKKLTDPREPKLGRAPEFEAFRSRAAVGETFVRLSGLLGYLTMLVPPEDQALFDAKGLPSGGSASMFARTEITSGRAFSMKTKLEMPAPFLQDVIALVKRAAEAPRAE